MVPSPSFTHQNIVANIGLSIRNHVRENGHGIVLMSPFDVVLSEENVVRPDVLFVSNERRGIITENNAIGAPDLVIEVLSPSTADRDREQKLKLYSRFGVREYWIVDPEGESVQVMRLGPGGPDESERFVSGEVSSSMLRGFAMEIAQVFAES